MSKEDVGIDQSLMMSRHSSKVLEATSRVTELSKIRINHGNVANLASV